MWNWFLTYGDKILAAITTIVGSLSAAGVLKGETATAVLALLTSIHNIVLPEPKDPTK